MFDQTTDSTAKTSQHIKLTLTGLKKNYDFFKNCGKIYMALNLPFEPFVSVQFTDIKYTHIAVQNCFHLVKLKPLKE